MRSTVNIYLSSINFVYVLQLYLILLFVISPHIINNQTKNNDRKKKTGFWLARTHDEKTIGLLFMRESMDVTLDP